ncbi:MAG: YebC/PmpR family DNA-binding transcriptional regulator [Patescibacteria group bacterium]
MSGHSKWSKIKHQKGDSDARKGKVFTKISKLITIAAKSGGGPDANASLRYAINQAKTSNMPADKIDRAIKKGTGELQGVKLEETMYEIFGPGGSAILVTGITDNKNRTSNEIKHLLSKNNMKLAEPGSASWAFKKTANNEWEASHQLEISEKSDKEKLERLIETLEDHDDVQAVYTNASY